jgi:mono/diheme cytochrome c family protein
MMRTFIFLLLTLYVLAGAAPAEDDFSKTVAAIFERRCLSCHNNKDKKGGLSLVTQKDLRAGGENGAVVAPGKPADSLLLDYITGDKPAMPKTGPPLAVEEVAAIRRWIAAGAQWPADLVLQDRSLADADWWSLRALTRPAVPQIQNPKSKIQNPIDAFIVAKLQERGLAQSPAAHPRTLIRRLSFDLVGLPPTPEEAEAFVTASSPSLRPSVPPSREEGEMTRQRDGERENAAYEALVDRLLASPQYGERWARHWLDVVHFGETHGYDKDKPRPNAWPYRDYVIRALNSDKPYGRFIEEQLAGDVLYPGSVDGIEALGFIAAGPWDFIGHAELPETKIDGQVARHLDRDDMVQNATGTFLSLTVGCAQCHNHKFDPVTQREYYQLQAVFAALDRHDKAYDRDPAVAGRRGEMAAELARLANERKKLDEEIKRRGGEELGKLDVRIAEQTKAAAGKERPEFGYHSAIEPKQEVTKWVQVDLGSPQRIVALEYAACHDDFNGIGAGFGFPLRYKIEESDDAEFKAGVTTLVDRTTADVANPGVAPQRVELLDVTARYVRVTATKLASRLPTDFIFALAELSVFSADGRNVAAGAPVTALDSIEAPVRWRRSNLVDGYYFGQAGDAAAELANLTKERDALLGRLVDAEAKRRLDELAAATTKAEQDLKALPPQQLVYAGTAFRGEGNFAGTGGVPRSIRILARGSVTQPGEEVRPGALACLNLPFAIDPATRSEGNRRAALARWISDRRNPLTWRSIANRVWQYHFGRGLVDTPNDFGRMGEAPTHPELLDWLAVELRDGGQSLKKLHKLIVMSHTYRQTSAISDFGFQISDLGGGDTSNPKSIIQNPKSLDSDNRLLWRANRRRLEAEALRDAVLLVADKLDTTMGGPSFQDFVIERPEHSPHYEYHLFDPDDPRSHRRSIYRFIVRSQPQPFMTTLDCADPSQRVDKRNESLSAIQALATLNNGFMVAMSRHWAERVAKMSGNVEEQAVILFGQALARPPTADERTALAAYISGYGLANGCRVVLNLNEFAFVD